MFDHDWRGRPCDLLQHVQGGAADRLALIGEQTPGDS
jgi:hypothetical protein